MVFKKPLALAMLGSAELVHQLFKSNLFETNGIKLEDKNYSDLDELKNAIQNKKNVEFVIASDTGLQGIIGGKKALIERVREIADDILIVLFMNYEKPDKEFTNWAYGMKVYHIYYPRDAKGNYNFAEIIPQIAAREMPKSVNSEELQQKERLLLEQEQQIIGRDSKIKEMAAEIDRLRRQPEQTQPSETDNNKIKTLESGIEEEKKRRERLSNDYEQLKRNVESDKQQFRRQLEQEKREEIARIQHEHDEEIERMRKQMELNQAIKDEAEEPAPEEPILTRNIKTTICIGVFSVSPGGGATSMAISIGELLTSQGLSVAVVAYDDSIDLSYLEGGKATYIIPQKNDDKKECLAEAITSGYDYTVIDFGAPYSILPSGHLNIGEGNVTRNCDTIAELGRCDYKFGIGSAEPWHIFKLRFFEEDPAFSEGKSVFCINGYAKAKAKASKEINASRLWLCENDFDVMKSILDNLGIRPISKPQEKQKRRFW